MLDITFYQIKDKPNVVNKTLGIGTNITGNVTEFSRIDRPRLVCRNMQVDYNYCYIRDYDRYYYITDITNKTNSVCEISLELDYLMSFRNIILQSKGLVTNAKYESNTFVSNRSIVTDTRTDYKDYTFDTNPLITDLTIVLIVKK